MKRRHCRFVVGWVAGLLSAMSVAGSATPQDSPPKERDSEKNAPRKANRLVKEKSPYLLQHAYNPVDWYPWGDEAFARAEAEKKPVFLSIGYSTCHWCHVMERESFEDEEIAAYLNEHFIAVKVDREERPDVDEIYMSAVQLFTGRGGWPLSVFLNGERKPFFGGTYFPPRDHPRRGSGFLTLLHRVRGVWEENSDLIQNQAQRITERLQQTTVAAKATAPLRSEFLDTGFEELQARYDGEFGGFGSPPEFAPKFPRTSTLDFLMRYGLANPEKNADALAIVDSTLQGMIRGGIRDHLAGGFHRYSVDRQWLVPHFEKMLYDQALITVTLVDAYRVTRNPRYLDVAKTTMGYVLSRMRGPEGELYCAEDADTDHVEGKTYVWTQAEILTLLGPARGERFCRYYGVTAEGNFEEGGEHACVLNVDRNVSLDTLAKEAKMGPDSLLSELAADRTKLLAVRDKRAQPLRDDKVLTAWLGMAIGALAQLYQVTGDAEYRDAARKAAEFVEKRLTLTDGALARRYRGGETIGRGYLNDYAFLSTGLLDLYEATFERRWLAAALQRGEELIELFWDKESGGFFLTSGKHETLIVRSKEFYDGAVPAGNSVAFGVLLRLYELTGRGDFETVLEEMERVSASFLGSSPSNYPRQLCAAYFLLSKPREIVVVGARGDATTEAMLSLIQRSFLPGKVVLHAEDAAAANALAELSPLCGGKVAIDGKATAYVCQGGVCQKPARDVATLKEQLGIQ